MKAYGQEDAEKCATSNETPAQESSFAPEKAESSIGVRELKGLLARQGIDYSGCVEKSDLAALWKCFTDLRSQPLASLQASCAAAGGPFLADAAASAQSETDLPPQAASPAGAPVIAPAVEEGADNPHHENAVPATTKVLGLLLRQSQWIANVPQAKAREAMGK